MAINPLLSLQTRALDFGQAANQFTQGRQVAQQQAQQKELIDLRKKGLELKQIRAAVEQQDKASQRRIKNNALDSFQLKRAIDRGGPEAGLEFLKRNKQRNDQFGLDSNETLEAEQLLQAGETEKLNTMLDNNIFVGEALGLIETPEQAEQPSTATERTRQRLVELQSKQNLTREEQLELNAIKEERADEPNTQVNVNVGGEKFRETLNKESAERINTLVETGRSAVTTEQNLAQMGDLLVEGVQTGTIQPALTVIQGVADDFGVNIEDSAKRVGIENLSNLSGKEEFDRLARTVIIEGFEKFKGNLNDREVKLAMDAFANLGRSEDANVQAIASLRASQAIAKERGRRASQVDSRAEAKALEAELFEGSLEKFKNLKRGFEEDLRERKKASNDQAKEAGVPQSAIDAGVDAQVWQAMTPEEQELFK